MDLTFDYNNSGERRGEAYGSGEVSRFMLSQCPEDSDVTASGSIAQEDECRIISPLSLEKEVLFSTSPH